MTLLKKGACILGAVAAGACFSPCDSSLKAEKPSPGSSYSAEWIVKDCGATADFASHVKLSKHILFWNITSDSLFVVTGKGPVQLEWLNEGNLMVKYSAQEKVFRKESEWRGVRLQYLPRYDLDPLP